MVAAHPREPLVSETKGLRGWAATLPRAPAMVFFGNAGIGVLCTGIGVFYPLPSTLYPLCRGAHGVPATNGTREKQRDYELTVRD